MYTQTDFAPIIFSSLKHRQISIILVNYILKPKSIHIV